MKRKLVASSLVAVGLLELSGLTSPAAAFASAAPAAVAAVSWYIVYGARYEEQALKELPPGSFYTGPSNLSHFARTGNAPVGVYIPGYGPTYSMLTDDLNRQGTPANRSEGGRSQKGWFLPAPQFCSQVVSTLPGGGSKE
jgi:hypothetical protein